MDASLRTLVLGMLVLLGGAAPLAADAQVEFPSRPIRLVAPVPPGSPPDVVARLVAEPLARLVGQPVIVENKPGGNQTIGLSQVAGAPADGHTLGMVSLPTAVVPSLMASMPYDTGRDFAPVREIAWTSNVLVVRGDAPFSAPADLVAASRARAGKMAFASGGNGTPAHVMAELFREQAKLTATHVPYKGAADGVNAVMAGHVDFMLASAGSVVPHLRAGKLKGLAQSTEARLPALPSVPTFGELGYTGVTVRDWQGVVAPAGTPATALQRLSTAFGQALARAEVRERLQALAIEPVTQSDPEQFSAFFASELRRWAALAKVAGLQAH